MSRLYTLLPCPVFGVLLRPGPSVRAQSAGDTDCTLINCSDNTDVWAGEDIVWNKVFVRPVQEASGARGVPSKLVWNEVISGRRPELDYWACWADVAYPNTSDCELVQVRLTGADNNNSAHPNIRFNDGSTLCDGSTVSTSMESDNGCIVEIRYAFDVRRFRDGESSKPYVKSFVKRLNSDTKVQARKSADCSCSNNTHEFAIVKPTYVMFNCGPVDVPYFYKLLSGPDPCP